MPPRPRVLVLWNQIEEDIYEQWRQAGPRKLAWDPTREVPDVGTVAEENAAMVSAIREAGWDVVVVNIEEDLERLFGAVKLHRPDVIMNLVEYFNDDSSQEPYIAGCYEMLGYHYTGNRPYTLSLCQNKYKTKVVLEAAGLPTAPYILAHPKQEIPSDHELDFPVIVKPSQEDASGGISHSSVVHTQEALEERIRAVHKEYEMPALVEEYIEGREFHAAILGNDPPEVLPLFEMEFDDSEFNPDGEWRPQIISFRAKWDPHSKDFYSMDAVCPPEDLDPEVEAYIEEVALDAFKAVGGRDYARIDMRFDAEEGEVYILEVNPNPDLVDGAAYMMCANASGRTYAETLGEILGCALTRKRVAEERARLLAAKADLPSDQLLREWVKQTQPPPAAPHTPPLEGASTTAAAPEPGNAEPSAEPPAK